MGLGLGSQHCVLQGWGTGSHWILDLPGTLPLTLKQLEFLLACYHNKENTALPVTDTREHSHVEMVSQDQGEQTLGNTTSHIDLLAHQMDLCINHDLFSEKQSIIGAILNIPFSWMYVLGAVDNFAWDFKFKMAVCSLSSSFFVVVYLN